MTDLTRNEPLKDIVYDTLRYAILNGVIPVGQAINQKLIADYLNVSRTPIRIAIHRLKHEQLLEETPEGLVVKFVSIDNVSEFFQIFLALETIAFTNAMQHMNHDQFQKIESILATMIQEHTNDNMSFVEQSIIEYKRLLVNYAKMPQLERFLDQLKEYVFRFANISLFSKKRRTEMLFEYVVVTQCMKNKNEQALSAVLKDHFATIKAFIINHMAMDKKNGYVLCKTRRNL